MTYQVYIAIRAVDGHGEYFDTNTVGMTPEQAQERADKIDVESPAVRSYSPVARISTALLEVEL